jgi:hypothetical protein
MKAACRSNATHVATRLGKLTAVHYVAPRLPWMVQRTWIIPPTPLSLTIRAAGPEPSSCRCESRQVTVQRSAPKTDAELQTAPRRRRGSRSAGRRERRRNLTSKPLRMQGPADLAFLFYQGGPSADPQGGGSRRWFSLESARRRTAVGRPALCPRTGRAPNTARCRPCHVDHARGGCARCHAGCRAQMGTCWIVCVGYPTKL